MIKVYVEEKDNKIQEVLFKGHALYDEFGKDIVCASVSSIVITTINGILSIDKDAIMYEEKPNLKITFIKNDDCYKLLLNMINLLKELEHDYPKNIKIL